MNALTGPECGAGGVPHCRECFEHYMQTPHLVGACASVGIEHGKSTSQMLTEYFERYHAREHRAA